MEKLGKNISLTILMIVVFFSYSCQDSTSTLDKELLALMKTGKFIYKGTNKGFIVEKTENTQIEYMSSSDYKIEFKVIWKNDYKYDMIFIGGTKGCLIPGDTINVEIKSVTKEGYKYHAYNERCGGEMTGELVKIE